MTDDTETILIFISLLVGIVCFIAAQTKRGIIMGSIRSEFRGSTKKYVERGEMRKPFYILLGVAFVFIVLIALLFLRDLESIVMFTILNLLPISYFLAFFVLLEPKDKTGSS